VYLGTSEVDTNDEQPELLLFAAVPRVRYLVVAVLIAGVHPHRDRLGRYDLEIYTVTAAFPQLLARFCRLNKRLGCRRGSARQLHLTLEVK